MELRNHSPFSPFYLKSRDKNGRPFDVFVVKGTYDIVDNARLKISQQQEPITVADEYWGSHESTSLRRHGDLAPFKSRADVFVIGNAHAPGGRPAPSWLAEVRAGETRKVVRVYGPRMWRRSAIDRWSLGEADPCTVVPLRYELAYGGSFRDREELALCDANPIGLGFVRGDIPSEIREIPAPRIEDAREPIEALGQPSPPAGFGPLCRHWQPRIAHAGTFDARWRDEKWPLMPDDWDDAFNNAAHPDLIHPGYFEGGEPVSVVGMAREGLPSFRLPRDNVAIRVRYSDGEIVTHPTNLDTLLVDLIEEKVILVFRARIDEVGSIRVIEILMPEVEHG